MNFVRLQAASIVLVIVGRISMCHAWDCRCREFGYGKPSHIEPDDCSVGCSKCSEIVEPYKHFAKDGRCIQCQHCEAFGLYTVRDCTGTQPTNCSKQPVSLPITAKDETLFFQRDTSSNDPNIEEPEEEKVNDAPVSMIVIITVAATLVATSIIICTTVVLYKSDVCGFASKLRHTLKTVNRKINKTRRNRDEVYTDIELQNITNANIHDRRQQNNQYVETEQLLAVSDQTYEPVTPTPRVATLFTEGPTLYQGTTAANTHTQTQTEDCATSNNYEIPYNGMNELVVQPSMSEGVRKPSSGLTNNISSPCLSPNKYLQVNNDTKRRDSSESFAPEIKVDSNLITSLVKSDSDKHLAISYLKIHNCKSCCEEDNLQNQQKCTELERKKKNSNCGSSGQKNRPNKYLLTEESNNDSRNIVERIPEGNDVMDIPPGELPTSNVDECSASPFHNYSEDLLLQSSLQTTQLQNVQCPNDADYLKKTDTNVSLLKSTRNLKQLNNLEKFNKITPDEAASDNYLNWSNRAQNGSSSSCSCIADNIIRDSDHMATDASNTLPKTIYTWISGKKEKTDSFKTKDNIKRDSWKRCPKCKK